MLTQLCADARQQHREAERLGDVIVGAAFQPENGIGIGAVAGQHDDRRLEAVLAHDTNDLAAINIRQADIHDDKIDLLGFRRGHRLAPAIDGQRLEFVMQCDLLHQCPEQVGVVVHDQNFSGIRHR